MMAFCAYCDEQGFCKKYSNSDVVWKCPGNGDCEGYWEVEDGK